MDNNIWSSILLQSQNIRVGEVCKYWNSLICAYEKALDITTPDFSGLLLDVFYLSAAIKHMNILEWTKIFHTLSCYYASTNKIKYIANLIVKNNLLYYPKELEYAIETKDIPYIKYIMSYIGKSIEIKKFIIECAIYYHKYDYIFDIIREIDGGQCGIYHRDGSCKNMGCILLSMDKKDDPIMKAAVTGKHYLRNTEWLVKTEKKKFGYWAGFYAIDYDRTDLLYLVHWVYQVEFHYSYWLELYNRASCQEKHDLAEYIDSFFPD